MFIILRTFFVESRSRYPGGLRSAALAYPAIDGHAADLGLAAQIDDRRVDCSASSLVGATMRARVRRSGPWVSRCRIGRTRAGLGQAQHIAALEYLGNGLLLNGCRGGEAHALDAGKNARV